MMRSQRGFSLVELMVAMTITLIVSAAIYGLLTSGSNAFRREPEVAERQQNIRAAMDLISRDVYTAGTALPTFAQAFTQVDPAGGACTGGLNGCGPAGTLGATAAAARGDNDPSPNTDVLEIVGADERCSLRSACSGTPAVAGTVVVRGKLPSCLGLPGLVLLTDNASFTIQPGSVGTGSEVCPSGGDVTQNDKVQLGAVLSGWAPAATMTAPAGDPPPATPVVLVYAARVVRYRIAPGTDPGDTAPALWRSTSGRFTAAGTAVAEPGEAGFVAAGSPWEQVARGIEDLQIEYQAGTDSTKWTNRPPAVVAGGWDQLVRQVRITLSARAAAPNLQGQTTAAGAGPNALRGQLTTVVAPRAAFDELQMQQKIK